GLAVIDFATDVSDPTLVGTLSTHGAVNGVTLVGTTLYLFDQGEGVIAVDVSSPENPVRLGTYHSPGYIRGIDKGGDHLYFTDYWNGVTILGVSDPTKPTLAGFYQIGPFSGKIGGIRLQDGMAYVAGGYNGLEILDLADPVTPTHVGQYVLIPDTDNDPMMSAGLGVKDGVLVTSIWYNTEPPTSVFDVSDPTIPVPASPIEQGYINDWAISDQLVAYGIMFGGCGLVIHDLS
ncbi:MAG: hypothetical protein JSU63_08425, partial [Phycisphaerales bacterium]